jgi:hypothetical protein
LKKTAFFQLDGAIVVIDNTCYLSFLSVLNSKQNCRHGILIIVLLKIYKYPLGNLVKIITNPN